jgi:hypothetical protein
MRLAMSPATAFPSSWHHHCELCWYWVFSIQVTQDSNPRLFPLSPLCLPLQVDFALDSRSKRPSLVQLRAALDGAGLRVTKHHDLTQHYSRYMEVLDETLITTGDSAGEAKGVQEMVRVRSLKHWHITAFPVNNETQQ